MLKKLFITMAATMVLAISPASAADDYHKYYQGNIGGHMSIYDIGGYIDNNGRLGGQPGDEYVIFNESGTGYIYRVTVNGDPNAHPDANGLAVADRNFTLVSQSTAGDLGGWGGGQEFYVDDTGIYFGSGNGIWRWDHNWTNKTQVVTPSVALYSETLAKNATTGEWWTATGSREVFKYDTSTDTWISQFTYPDLAGGHHDGMEIVNDKLYLSDMTSDKIIVYDLNESGDVVLDSNVTYSYTATPYVEGMGYGPNQHFWMSAGEAYEIGDGKLIPSCSQQFIYTTSWSMDTSKCDEINVPGIEDAVLVVLVTDSNGNPSLHFSTADAGAKNWLENNGFTVVDHVVLKTGEGFFTLGKSALDQTVNTGKLRNNYVALKNNEYTFIGFKNGGNLAAIFAGKPVEEIRYYDGSKWHLWKPSTGSETIPAGQGVYVLPNGDFSLNLK